jgi:hypothetical protein
MPRFRSPRILLAQHPYRIVWPGFRPSRVRGATRDRSYESHETYMLGGLRLTPVAPRTAARTEVWTERQSYRFSHAQNSYSCPGSGTNANIPGNSFAILDSNQDTAGGSPCTRITTSGDIFRM